MKDGDGVTAQGVFVGNKVAVGAAVQGLGVMVNWRLPAKMDGTSRGPRKPTSNNPVITTPIPASVKARRVLFILFRCRLGVVAYRRPYF